MWLGGNHHRHLQGRSEQAGHDSTHHNEFKKQRGMQVPGERGAILAGVKGMGIEGRDGVGGEEGEGVGAGRVWRAGQYWSRNACGVVSERACGQKGQGLKAVGEQCLHADRVDGERPR